MFFFLFSFSTVTKELIRRRAARERIIQQRGGGKSTREGARRGVEWRERMKRGSGMKGRDEG